MQSQQSKSLVAADDLPCEQEVGIKRIGDRIKLGEVIAQLQR